MADIEDAWVKAHDYSSGDVLQAVREYTWGGPNNQGVAFDVNHALRTGEGLGEHEDVIKALDAAGTELPEDKKLYRMVSGSDDLRARLISTAKNEGTWLEAGYVSTTGSEELTEGFGDAGHPVLLEISAPKGTRAIRVGDYLTDDDGYDQDEYILPRGSKLILSNPRYEDDVTVITAEVFTSPGEPFLLEGRGVKVVKNPTYVESAVWTRVSMGSQKDKLDLPVLQTVDVAPGQARTLQTHGDAAKLEGGTSTANPVGYYDANGRVTIADGHHRAVRAWDKGNSVPVDIVDIGQLSIETDTDAERAEFDRMVERTRAGGKLGTSSTPAATPAAPMHVEEPELPSIPVAPAKHRVPMEFKETPVSQVPAYADDPNYYFQQKVDGIRGQLVLDPGAKPWFRSKSGDQLQSSTASKISGPLLAKMGDGLPAGSPSVTIDGEMLDGKWYVFDMTVEGQNLPWEDRMDMADKWVANLRSQGLTQIEALPTARTPEEKMALFNAIRDGGGEGVMIKRRTAKYKWGQRTEEILKAKITSTADVVVMERNRGGKDNAIIGVYKNGKLTEVAAVSTIGKEKTTPIKVGDVIEVEYLNAHPSSGKLTQARFKKVRPDKKPLMATDSQFRYVSKDVHALPEAPGDPAADAPAGPLAAVSKTDAADLHGRVQGAGDRADFMREALSGYERFGDAATVVARTDADGRPLAAASLVRHDPDEDSGMPGYLTLDYAATSESGHGRDLVEAIRAEGERQGLPVYLEPTADSLGFWTAMGAVEDPDGIGTEFYGWPSDGPLPDNTPDDLPSPDPHPAEAAWRSPEAQTELAALRAERAEIDKLYQRYSDFAEGKGVARGYSKAVWSDFASAAYKEYNARNSAYKPRNEAWIEKYGVDWPEDEIAPDPHWDDLDDLTTKKVGTLDEDAWEKIRNMYVVPDEQTIRHNASLRSPDPTSAAKTWRSKVSRMVRDQVTVDDAQLYRVGAFTPEFIEQLEPGAKIRDPGFTSTGDDIGTAIDYSSVRVGTNPGTVPIYFHVRVPPGTPAADVGYGEIVLDYGNTMEILEVGMVDDRRTVVVRLIPKGAEGAL